MEQKKNLVWCKKYWRYNGCKVMLIKGYGTSIYSIIRCGDGLLVGSVTEEEIKEIEEED